MPTRYAITVTDPARDDLVAIHQRLSERAKFPLFPGKVRSELVEAIGSLTAFALRGAPRGNGVRILPTPSDYNIVYRVDGDTVTILRIRHQRQRRAARP